MVLFYDPKDDADLQQAEAVLHKGGIEYFLRRALPGGNGRLQICVAEEDLPTAQQLVEQREKERNRSAAEPFQRVK